MSRERIGGLAQLSRLIEHHQCIAHLVVGALCTQQYRPELEPITALRLVARRDPRLPPSKILGESWRQFRLPSAAHDPFGDRSGSGNAGRIEGELARRQQLHQRHRLTAALVGGVDPSNALDLIAKPLNAEWRGFTRGEEVNDAAASSNLTTTTNERDGLVAEGDGARGHGVEGDAIPRAQEQSLGAQVSQRNRWLRHRE